jgi:acyl-coenzyme A synthetase/AMP-(fatty) acid ligase
MNNPKNTIAGEESIDQLILRLASGPIDTDQPYLIEGVTLGDIYAWADNIRTTFSESAQSHLPICICTLNRAHVAAAFIAALSGGPQLILPFGHTIQILEDIKHAMGYDFALMDEALPLPKGVKPIFANDTKMIGSSKTTLECLASQTPCLHLFTGGSTGTPQVWPKTPKNLLSEASYLATSFGITGNDTILATVPPYHIYGFLYSVLLPLITGARVSVETPFYPKEIERALAGTKATVFVSIPPHYRTLKENPVSHHHLHTAFSSAGALAEEDDWAFKKTTDIPITEIYGSTETGGIAFRKRAEGQSSLTTFLCVDTKIKGDELWVRSDFLSEKLPKDDDGFFQTSDRAEPEGTTGFRLLGRSDGIVKVGGKRVDLMEVQELLKKAPGVKDAYVFAKTVESGRGNDILALIEGQAEVDHIRQSAFKGLAPYAHPRHIQIVEKIPVSASGKYDRNAIEKLFK